MVIAPGKVGIGQTSPAAKIHISQSVTDEPALYAYSNSANTAPLVQIIQDSASSNSAAPALYVRNDGAGNAITVDDGSSGNQCFGINYLGYVNLGTVPPTENPNNESPLLIRNAAGGNVIVDTITYNCANDMLTVNSGTFISSGYIRSGAADMKFGTASQGVLITLDDGNGVVRMGATSQVGYNDEGMLQVKGKSAHTAMKVGNTSNGQRLLHFFNAAEGEVGHITGTASATSYNTSSDYRLKENVDYTWDATTRLKQLKPARFNWIADETNTLLDGFLAHEVSSIVPEAITGSKDGTPMQAIDQSKLVPLLVKTVQELEARIKTLEG
jgi:hypothetical protein